MATDSDHKNALTREEEVDHAEKAFEEYRLNKVTHRKCLKCGGSYMFEDFGAAYRIRCSTKGCFILTVRGI